MPSTGLIDIHQKPESFMSQGNYPNDPVMATFESDIYSLKGIILTRVEDARMTLAHQTESNLHSDQAANDAITLALIEELAREDKIASGVKLFYEEKDENYKRLPVIAIFKPIVGSDNSFIFTFVVNGILYSIGGKSGDGSQPIDTKVFLQISRNVASLPEYSRLIDPTTSQQDIGVGISEVRIVNQFHVSSNSQIPDQVLSIIGGYQKRIANLEYKKPSVIVV